MVLAISIATGLHVVEGSERMMSIALVLLIGGGFFFAIISMIVEAIRTRHKKPLLRTYSQVISAAFILYGAMGFFGTGLSTLGVLNWLPGSVELPMGWVDGAVTDRDGNFYCPSPFARIQVYDHNKNYLRGWFVDARTGSYKINTNSHDQLEVVTSRLNTYYIFDLYGKLLSKSTYQTYSDFDDWKGQFIWIPTSPFLLPLSHPFGCALMAILGMVLFDLATTKKIWFQNLVHFKFKKRTT